MKIIKCVQLLLIFAATAVSADQHNEHLWQLNNGLSKLSYGTIKKNSVGEVNHFRTLTGHIDKEGKVLVNIDLTSIETYIDIRNTRMIDYVFGKDVTTATLTASVDLSKIHSLQTGAIAAMDIEGSLALFDNNIPIETTMKVAKLGENQFMALTDEMIMIKTESMGVKAGIDKLKALAKLDSITRVVPVSMHLVFSTDATDAEIAQISAIEHTTSEVSSIDKGKKLYKQCIACHSISEEVNGLGPHLVGIVGRQSGAVEDFSYSPALSSANITWDKENLTAFMKNPQATISGNTMPFIGIDNEDDVAAIVDYLESLQ